MEYYSALKKIEVECKKSDEFRMYTIKEAHKISEGNGHMFSFLFRV